MRAIISMQALFFLCFGAISGATISAVIDYRSMQASTKAYAALIGHVPVDRLSDITIQ